MGTGNLPGSLSPCAPGVFLSSAAGRSQLAALKCPELSWLHPSLPAACGAAVLLHSTGALGLLHRV